MTKRRYKFTVTELEALLTYCPQAVDCLTVYKPNYSVIAKLLDVAMLTGQKVPGVEMIEPEASEPEDDDTKLQGYIDDIMSADAMVNVCHIFDSASRYFTDNDAAQAELIIAKMAREKELSTRKTKMAEKHQ